MRQWLTHCLLETFKDFLVSLSSDEQHKMFTVTVTTVLLCLLLTSLLIFATKSFILYLWKYILFAFTMLQIFHSLKKTKHCALAEDCIFYGI